MKRLFLKPFKKLSRGRRLNIKRVIFFPLIVYAVYVFIDSFLPLFIVGFVIWLLYSWTGKRRFWWLNFHNDHMDIWRYGRIWKKIFFRLSEIPLVFREFFKVIKDCFYGSVVSWISYAHTPLSIKLLPCRGIWRASKRAWCIVWTLIGSTLQGTNSKAFNTLIKLWIPHAFWYWW